MSRIKQQRTAEQIRHILSELCRRHVHDPRLQDITITEVKLDRELQYADIYVNALGDESREQEVMAALNKANGFLRRELGGRLRLRNVPVLHFHWDPTLAHAEHISQLLDTLDIPPEEPEEEEE
jgi:ribosome-binding factor A